MRREKEKKESEKREKENFVSGSSASSVAQREIKDEQFWHEKRNGIFSKCQSNSRISSSENKGKRNVFLIKGNPHQEFQDSFFR